MPPSCLGSPRVVLCTPPRAATHPGPGVLLHTGPESAKKEGLKPLFTCVCFVFAAGRESEVWLVPSRPQEVARPSGVPPGLQTASPLAAVKSGLGWVSRGNKEE